MAFSSLGSRSRSEEGSRVSEKGSLRGQDLRSRACYWGRASTLPSTPCLGLGARGQLSPYPCCVAKASPESEGSLARLPETPNVQPLG